MRCHAVQHSDQMVCHVCHLAWDMNDPEPPPCGGKVVEKWWLRPMLVRAYWAVACVAVVILVDVLT